MPNPNNNKHFNDEALKINRTLKKENDALSEIIDEVENFFFIFDVELVHIHPAVDKIKQMIAKARSRDEN